MVTFFNILLIINLILLIIIYSGIKGLKEVGKEIREAKRYFLINLFTVLVLGIIVFLSN